MLLPLNKKANAHQTEQAELNPNEARRQMLLRSISLLAIPALFIFSAVMFFRGEWIHGLLNLGVGAIVALGMIYLPRIGQTQLILRSISALIGLLLLYDMAKGGSYGEMLHWMYTWPLLVFFSHGKKEGLLWMIPMLLAIQIILWLPLEFVDVHPYPRPVKIRFLVSYFIVTALAFFFESTRQVFHDGLVSERAKIASANRSLQQTNERLENEIKQRRGPRLKQYPLRPGQLPGSGADGSSGWQPAAPAHRNHAGVR